MAVFYLFFNVISVSGSYHCRQSIVDSFPVTLPFILTSQFIQRIDPPCRLGVTLRGPGRLQTICLHLHYPALTPTKWSLWALQQPFHTYTHSPSLHPAVCSSFTPTLTSSNACTLLFSHCLTPSPLGAPTLTCWVLHLTVSIATGWAKQLSSMLAGRQRLSSTPSPNPIPPSSLSLMLYLTVLFINVQVQHIFLSFCVGHSVFPWKYFHLFSSKNQNKKCFVMVR